MSSPSSPQEPSLVSAPPDPTSPDPAIEATLPSLPRREPKPFWRYFYYPMLAVSLALHGLLLAIPLPERAPTAEAPPEEEPEEIRLSSLTAPSTPRPTPAQPQPTVTPRPAASPQAIVRPPAPRPPAPPPSRPPAPSPQPTAAPSPIAASPSPTPSPTPTPDPYSEPFQDNLASATGAVQGQGIPYYWFPQPELFFTADSLQQAEANPGTDPTPVAGSSPMWVSNISIEDVTQKLPELFPGTSIADVGEFGGGKLYEARQGTAIRYISVIKGTGSGLTTFVVTWSRDPRQPLPPAQ